MNLNLMTALTEATRALADFQGGDSDDLHANLHLAEETLMTAMTEANKGDDTAPEATLLYDIALNICELIENEIH